MEFHTAERFYGTSNAERVFKRHFEYLMQRPENATGRHAEWMIMVGEIMQAAYQWPHYQVWPEYVAPLARVPMTDVEFRDFRSPFPAFTVQLPRTGDGLLFGDRNVETITIVDYTSAELWRSFRVFDKRMHSAAASNKHDDRNMAIIIQCVANEEEKAAAIAGKAGYEVSDPQRKPGNSIEIVRFVDWFSPHAMPVDEKLETVLDRMAVDQKTDKRNESISHIDPDDYRKCWRLACSVAFLATGKHRLIQPAVLHKDLAAYLEALGKDDDEKVRRLHNKASERRSSKGWTVGRLHQILVGKPTNQADGEPQPSGRELRNQHIRSAHYHTFRVGAGRQATIKKFVLPTIVRPDLPLPAQSPDRVLRKLQDDDKE